MVLPRYVELIRVSGSAQAARDTPADQRAALDRLRQTRAGVLVARIEEGAAGLSGALPLDQRPDLLRLVELAKARAFDEVRVRHLDRLTRHPDPRERFAIYGAVMDAGAVIVDAGGHVIDPDSEMGELDFTFQGIMSAKERKRILDRTLSARRRRAAEGKIQGPPPYGRTWDKKTGKWDVNEAEMKVYRRIFDDLLAGKSLNRIRADLVAEGVPSPGTRLRKNKAKCQWRAEYIAKLIRNRAAIGEVVWFGTTIKCPPVVDPAKWERACQCIVNPRAGRPPRDPVSALLRGIAHCHVCGSAMWVVKTWRPYYVCRYFRTARVSACRSHYPVVEVDEHARLAILDWLERDVAPEAGKPEAPADPAATIKDAEATLRLLGEEEARLLRAARKASAEAAEKALEELGREREEAKRALEAAKLLASRPEPVRPEVNLKRRAALLARARKATPAQLRDLALATLQPGDAVIQPGPRVEIRATGPRP